MGLNDGIWVEADRLKVGPSWRKLTGDEDVILADLSELTDGESVKVAQAATP